MHERDTNNKSSSGRGTDEQERILRLAYESLARSNSFPGITFKTGSGIELSSTSDLF